MERFFKISREITRINTNYLKSFVLIRVFSWLILVFALAIFAQIFAVLGSATTIVAVKTPKEIYIGADSKVTDTFGNTAANAQACKIVQAGSLFFAYAGFARDNQTGFSIPQIALDALNQKPEASIAERVDILTKTVVEKLNVELPLLKQSSFPTYREKIDGRTFLKILVAGFEKNKPVVLLRRFRFGETSEQTFGVIVSTNDCDAACTGKVVTRFLGETDAIDGLAEETKDFWKQGFAAGVRKLIETEIVARDDYVGAPVDILQITAKRAVWIQKKPLCAEIKNYPK